MKYLGLILILAVIACGTPDDESVFNPLESQVEENPTNANVSELLDLYSTWLDENPAVDADRKDVLIKMDSVSGKHIRHSKKLLALENLVLDYPTDPETADRFIEISEIFLRMRKTAASQIINQAVAQKFPTNANVKEKVFPQLPPNLIPIDSVISELGQAMFDDGSMHLNNRVARQYVNACEAYALAFDGEPKSAELLHKAAETARTLNTINKAIELYDWILRRYPNDSRTAQALFLKAFTYDSNLGDVEKARTYYQEFLDKYPNDDFASSAQFLLDNLGKDDDELLDILQNKSQEEG